MSTAAKGDCRRSGIVSGCGSMSGTGTRRIRFMHRSPVHRASQNRNPRPRLEGRSSGLSAVDTEKRGRCAKVASGGQGDAT